MMLTAAKKKKLLLLDSSTLTYAYLKRRGNVDTRGPVNEIFKERYEFGEFHHLFNELREYPELFKNYTRMSIATFDHIVDALKNDIHKKTTNIKSPISVEERLIVTLRYLVTGMQFRQLAYSFRISKSAVSNIVIEVCKSLWKCLQQRYMPVPTKDCLKNIALDFQQKWNFPNCIGAIDGKHFRVKRPPKSGIMYRNYKGLYSINVLTVTDASYKFVFADVGGYGKDSDGGMFGASKMGKFLETKSIDLPEDCNLPDTNIVAPHVLIGDEGFPLRTYLMRPYPRRQLLPGGEKDVFNYRLARARMVVECSYGSIKSKFNVLSLPIETKVENAVVIVKAILLLHNIIRERDGISEEEAKSFREVAGKRTNGTPRVRNNSTTNQAKVIRKRFSSYFVRREGVMPHQELV